MYRVCSFTPIFSFFTLFVGSPTSFLSLIMCEEAILSRGCLTWLLFVPLYVSYVDVVLNLINSYEVRLPVEHGEKF